MNMKFIIFLILFSLNTFSQESCKSNVEFFENMRIQTGQFKSKDCYISISPRKNNGMFYRTYLITSSGKFLIFNSFGTGPSKTHSGAREFNFFKRNSKLSYKVFEKTVDITLANGDRLTFNKELALPVSIDRGYLTYDPVVTPENNGGIEILNYKGLLMDFGFQMGMSPSWYLKRTTKIIDENSNTCSISNSEILYKKNSDIHWIYRSDKSLFSYLQKRCPSIVLPK